MQSLAVWGETSVTFSLCLFEGKRALLAAPSASRGLWEAAEGLGQGTQGQDKEGQL